MPDPSASFLSEVEQLERDHRKQVSALRRALSEAQASRLVFESLNDRLEKQVSPTRLSASVDAWLSEKLTFHAAAIQSAHRQVRSELSKVIRRRDEHGQLRRLAVLAAVAAACFLGLVVAFPPPGSA